MKPICKRCGVRIEKGPAYSTSDEGYLCEMHRDIKEKEQKKEASDSKADAVERQRRINNVV